MQESRNYKNVYPYVNAGENMKKVNILLLLKIIGKKMLNKSCFFFEIQTYLKIIIISYFRGPRVGIVIGKPYSKLIILRTLRKDFKGQKR